MAEIRTYRFTQTAQRLQAIMDRVEDIVGVETFTCTTTGTTHAITGGSTGFDNAVFKFKADADFNASYTVTVNGVIVTCLLPTGDTVPDGFIVSGASALCILDGTTLYFVGGGGKGSGIKYFLNQTVSTWVSDSTYTGYPYKGFISIQGVSSADGVEVAFSNADANSGNYSPICQSTADGVYIWAKTQPQSLTIPTIAISVNSDVDLQGEVPYLSTEHGGTVTGDVTINGNLTANNLAELDDLTINKISWSDKWLIADNTDFNDLKTIGVYYVYNNASMATMSNKPHDDAGTLTVSDVMRNTDVGTELSGNWQYVTQRFETYNGVEFVRRINTNGSGVWSYGEWYRVGVSRINDVVITANNVNPASSLGGTWVEIDREFASRTNTDITSQVTLDSTNCSAFSCWTMHSGHSIRFAVRFTTSVAMSADARYKLATIPPSAVGASVFGDGYYFTMYSDAKNCLLSLYMDGNGNFYIDDVWQMQSNPSQSVTAGQFSWFNFTIDLPKDYLLTTPTTWVNKYYWRRTA